MTPPPLPRPTPPPRPTADKAASIGRALPFLVLLVAVVADLATTDAHRLDRLLFAVPALAAVAWGPVATAGTGLIATAATLALYVGRSGFENLGFPYSTVVALLLLTLVSAGSSALRERRERQLRQVGAIADTTQRAVQRPLPSRLGGTDLHLLYEASARGARVGGDFHQAVPVPGGVRLMVGDVQGKGLGAVEASALLLGSFRESAYTADDLPEVARRLDATMRRHGELCPDSEAAERFATVLLVEIPDDGAVARVLSCGHPAPLVQHDGQVTTVPLPDPALPVNLPGLANDEFDVVEIPFAPADRLLLFTDGVSETRDAAGDFYPLEDRARSWAAHPADEVLPLLGDDLTRHASGALTDDTTAVLAVRR
ncbi:PP2C family protein-serine/threonine phosphatase [Streptomyces sp. NPDC056144]|uniref:PP2C family protein-serine/threonine phosphatase n=1 Tax=unclassified Streptomyces TaxID=2593676 RepID=UPI0035D6BFF0